MKFIISTLLLTTGLSYGAVLAPPVAKQQEHLFEKFGDIRSDEYYWLKERTSPEVIKYLKAENKYLNTSLKNTEKLQKTLFEEMKAHVKQDDSTYPLKDGPYFYYTRFEKNQQYPIYARKKEMTGPEEIIFNVNDLAKKHSYYQAHYKASPDHQVAALAVDTVGRRFYSIRFKDLKTGKFLKDEIKSVTDNFVWAQDNKTLFYTRQDPETLRWYQVYRYNLEQKKSELVYEEKQDTFETSVDSSLAEKHIFITSSSTLSGEVRVVDSLHPETAPELLMPREKEHELSVTEDEDSYYILSNKDAKDFKIMRRTFADLKAAPETFLAHRPGTHIDNLMVFKDYVVVNSRENGLTQIEVITKKTKKLTKLDFKDSAYTVELGANAEYAQNFLRYTYTSLRSPVSVYDYDFTTQKSELRKAKEVPHYNADNYVSERIFVTSRDGRKIPVSLLMKKDLKHNATAPMLIYGYGSYGVPMDPWFSPTVFSLVDRGYVYAIAHVRGGGEMGRFWTDEGRTLNKKNTFYDFIDATEFLVQQKYANPKKVFAMGGSAGGLLMGAIANLRPDLYHGIIAQVPFVDVLTTMLDDSIPLTTAEYDEWGNPNEKKYYDYIKSYSPYDNVSAQAYPHLLIETGLHDSQVQYWEPAKWTARLRKLNTSKNFIFLKTDMDAGHGGKSGRFDQLKEDALEYAFILENGKQIVPQNLKLHSILVSLFALLGIAVSFFFLDQQLAQYFKTPALESVYYYSREITNIGLSVHYFVIGIVAYAVSRWAYPHAFTRKWSLQLLKSLTAIGIAMPVVKFITGRQRPHLSPDFDSRIFSHFTFDWHFHSFPSGHAQVLFTVATILLLMWPRQKYVFLILAALFSFTRVTIQQHFLSDVLAGAAIGYLGTLWVCRLWVSEPQLTKDQKKN